MMFPRIASCLAALLCLSTATSADDEIVREFKRYYRTYEHPAERGEVVAHRDDPGLLLGTDCDPERRSGRSR